MWMIQKLFHWTKFKNANNDVFSNVFTRIKSVKSALWQQEVADKKPAVTLSYDISNNNVCYLKAQENLGVTQNNTE